jgi:hypothetical protein
LLIDATLELKEPILELNALVVVATDDDKLVLLLVNVVKLVDSALPTY